VKSGRAAVQGEIEWLPINLDLLITLHQPRLSKIIDMAFVLNWNSFLFHLVFNVGLLVLVQVDLEESGAVKTDPGALANDLSGVDQVIENSVVNGNQGTEPRTNKHMVTQSEGVEDLCP
jgi:hypothetical protein